MKHRRISKVVASTVVLLAISGTSVVHADDEAPDTTPTTQEAPPSTPRPTVSITVEDVPAEPEPTPTTQHTQPETTTGSMCDDTGCTEYEVPKDDTVMTCQAIGCTDVTTIPDSYPPKTTETNEEVAPVSGTTTTTTTTNPVQITSDQEAIVTGTQLANGNTGGNLTNNDQVNPGSVPANSIGTGDATAVGSDDENIVTQAADVVLTDQAIANVLQVALILNIGAALANSGANGAAGGAGGSGANGAIGTGDADATGLDMAQYITQAARAEGDENTDDAASQLAVSLWMGIATANSGVNAITGEGGTGSGGAINAGDASATGNHSLTDILQGAAVNGSGTSVTNVEQYATVMNLGFALANSGANDIAGVASGMLTAGTNQEQNDMAVDLFSMLLPALLSTYASSAGAGSIDTGNATAIGNDSETYIKQLAMAANSGDGIASIIQNILVANVGAAGANTGGNSIGGGYASLSPESAKAVVTLAAFLAQMLAMVHYQAGEQAQIAQEQGLDIPFGDIVLQVRGAMQGVDTTLTNPSGARANVRQVTIVLSLGWARANTGLNVGVNQDPDARALLQSNTFAAGVNDPALADQIRTANANGVNQGLVVICQRRNATDIECLAPPEPEPLPDDPADPNPKPEVLPPVVVEDPVTPIIIGHQEVTVSDPTPEPKTMSFLAQPETVQPKTTVVSGALPATGTDADHVLQFATWFLVGGGVLFTTTRRRRRRS
jgi:hypothetical protein